MHRWFTPPALMQTSSSLIDCGAPCSDRGKAAETERGECISQPETLLHHGKLEVDCPSNCKSDHVTKYVRSD
jgi:hypothetical protein